MKKTAHAIGKRIGAYLYIHRLALPLLEETQAQHVAEALAACPEAACANVFKIDDQAGIVSALDYTDFFESPFPELRQAWHIPLNGGLTSYRSYAQSGNPPILHRKELLLPPEHPKQAEFSALTAQAEALGLFQEAHLIGFARAWEDRIAQAGYTLCGHAFQPLGNDVRTEGEESAGDTDDTTIARHRTALSRSGLSAPVQALLRHGLLSPEQRFFDYGCGRGDDVRALTENGYVAEGWDPHYAPQNPRQSADVVNLGFVVNVIEDPDERVEALKGAFQLTRQVLSVAVMLYPSTPPPGKPFRDGYRTQRNTFQKYFTQTEFKAFVEAALSTEAIPVGPGVLLVFADPLCEQRFLFERQNRRTERFPRPARAVLVRPPRAPRPLKTTAPSRFQRRLDEHKSAVEAVWQRWLEGGREPFPDECVEQAALIAAFGSWRRVLRVALLTHSAPALEQARDQRRDDLIVFLALRLFQGKKPYRQWDIGIQRSIKAHFGDYETALAIAHEALREVAQPALLDEAARCASEEGLGYYVPSDYLQLESGLISRLPVRLRLYVGCGSVLYGDLSPVDVVKIHLRSGKLSLLKFDDFHGKPVPLMIERIKIKLRSLEMDFFFYGETVPPSPLYYKARYLNEESEGYAAQLAFDEALAALALFNPSGYGPAWADFEAALSAHRLCMDGFSLVPAHDIPDLEAPCGAYFSYRDLIECGETWAQTRTENRPQKPETYNALHALAVQVLDPVIAYFGMIRLTYGFAGPLLTKHIKSRIAPALDQHASCEVNRLGKLICPRQGAAVDFFVEDEDMLEVARWMVEHIPFDRLYVYGPDRPVHVSYAPTPCGQITVMLTGAHGRRYPKTLTAEAFKAFVWPV